MKNCPEYVQQDRIQHKFDPLFKKSGYQLTNKHKGLIEYTKDKWIIRLMFSRFGEFEVNLVPVNATEILEKVGYPINWVLEYLGISLHPNLTREMIVNTNEQADANASIVCEALGRHILFQLDVDKELPSRLLAYARKKNAEYNARHAKD